MRKHGLIVFCVGLCALLMLAGCGGNGGGSGMTGTGGDDTVDMAALSAAKTAAMTAYDAAKGALDAVEDDQSADQDSYDKAKAQVDAAKDANDNAQAASTVADAEKYRDMAQDANRQAIIYANMVTTAANNMAAATRAEKIAPVIARPNPSPAQGTSQFDGRIDRNSPNAPSADFTTRPLTVDGNKVSHSDNKKFAMSTDTLAELMGFAGSIHTREDRGAATSTRPRVTDEVTVYTDQEASTPTPFSGDGGVHTLDHGGTDDSTTDPHTALLIENALTTAVTGGKNGMTIGALVNITQHRPTAGTTTIMFGRDETENHDNKRLSGTFDMASGTYECATTCSITMNADGKLTADSTGIITFKPASGAMVPAPDTDYLTFGYWVRTSTPLKGDATTTIAPFATGKQAYTGLASYLATITTANTTVSATYMGSATGQFVHKTDVDGDGKGPVPTSSGQFRADAELTANFTSGTDSNLGVAFQNAINGKISNFKNSTGQNIEGWELILNPAKFDGSNTGSTEATRGGFTFSAGTSGGKDQPAGGWRGSFFGPATGPDGDDDGTDPDPIQPGSVAGEFLGHFENGHAVGAFGATKQDE